MYKSKSSQKCICRVMRLINDILYLLLLDTHKTYNLGQM